MAKKTDKAVKELAKEVKKLRKENEKLASAVEKAREDQAGAQREVLALLEDRLPGRDDAPEEPAESVPRGAGVARDNPSNESPVEAAEKPLASFMTPDTYSAPDAEGPPDAADQEGSEITEAAKRRAEELGVDLSDVEGTGSRGRILVRDVEAAAADGR